MENEPKSAQADDINEGSKYASSTSLLNSIQFFRDIGDVKTEYQLVSPGAGPDLRRTMCPLSGYRDLERQQ
jgi:hypothetical protein